MKKLLIGMLALTSISTFAGEFQDLYVTHAGCRVYSDGSDLDPTKDGVQSLEIWIYLSDVSPEYEPNMNISAYIYEENSINARRKCEELYKIYESKNKATFELKKHFYDDGSDSDNSSGWSGSKIVVDFAAMLTDNFSERLLDQDN